MNLESELVCQFETHNNNPITNICISKQCTQASRWLCRICYLQQIHQCGNNSTDNIINLKDLQKYFDNNLKAYYQEQVLYSQKNKQIYMNLIQIRQLIDEIINSFDQQIKLSETLNQVLTQCQWSIMTLSSDQLNQLINFRTKQINYQAVQDQIQLIIEQFSSFNNNIINYQLYFEKQTSFPCNGLQTAQISPNEQQFSYSNWQSLSLINLKSQKCLSKKIMKSEYLNIQYSPDSQFLLVTEEERGCLRVLQTKNKFKLIFRKNIVKDRYKQIQFLFKNNYQLMAFKSSNIQVLDITKRSIQEIKAGMGINAIDFDSRNKQIIIASYDGVFLFMDQLGQEIITIYIHKEIQNIKKTKNDDNLIVQKSSLKKLNLYQIDYENQSMVLLQRFQSNNKFQFQSVCDDQRIIILNGKKIVILNKNFQTIQELCIQGSSFSFIQVKSLEYILKLDSELSYLDILKKNYI